MPCGRAAERVLGLGLLLLATVVGAAEPEGPSEDFIVVQPGDTCQLLGQRLWGTPDGYRQLHALNALKNAHPPLVPGMRLRIRPEPEAHLTYVKPDVNTRPPQEPQWKPGRQGEALYRLYQVNTLRGAGAEVTLKDTSKLQLRENALVVIYGAPQATPKEPERKSGGVELVQGDLRMRLAALRGESLPLETPSAQVAATGQDVFVSVDEQRMSRVAVFDGKAQVSAKGARVEVPGGNGTRVEQGKAPEPPRPLLPAPAWSTPGVREVLLALGGTPQFHPLKWQPVPGAVSYRAVLAKDEGLNDLVAQAAPTSEVTATFETTALAPGRYYARVQAVDALGLPGMPSAPRKVEVVAVKVERGEAQDPVRVKGRGQVKLSVDPAAGMALRVKGKAVGTEAVMLAPGIHTVDAVGVLRPVSVEVQPSVSAEVTLRPEGDRFQLEVNARPTEAGAPPIADGAVMVSGLEGSTVSNLVRKSETRWEATVAPVKAGARLRAAVEVKAYGEAVGRANAEAEAR
ncbi:FecR domain-containing protein [Hyalangium rubrum]|uniref:FecR domain-containing protein n=1 Tax=Hyalangium rubrum TaxID=3103134 RepID=A0ABU5HFV7_9BACT|nr:FecR domain-containing protein [Hyalangium sp. s54d21]MDY7232338.1 FecR domain-containing protein [Hyalangium sp. s54d21]